MAVSAVCPGCQATFEVPEETLGRTVRCQKCQTTFVLAAAPLPAAPPVVEVVPTLEPVAQPASVEPRRLPPRPRRRRPQREVESAGSVLVPILVVCGVLLLLGGIAIAIVFAVHYVNSQDAPANNALVRPKGMPGPGDMPGMQPNMDNFNDPAGDTPLSFEVGNLDKPSAGLTRFQPTTPLPESKNETKAAPDGTMTPETLKKVKASTALLQVAMATGQGEGSGFFAFEPGLLVTNAHVVGMVGAAEAKPRNIDVILNSGESNERRLKGEVIGVDRYVDLAVVRVRGANLPEPLPVGRVKDVYETQRIYTVGFPFGTSRSHNVTVSATTVSSLVKSDGVVRKVQVVGAMNPGNSGGPVVDATGTVVAVSVSIFLTNNIIGGLTNTGISYAVPCDDVHYLYQGRLDRLDVGQPVAEGTTMKVPVTARFYDPAGQIRKVGIGWWIGEKGEAKDDAHVETETKPPLASYPGTSNGGTVELKWEHGVARGELELPQIPAGKVCWLRPHFELATPGLRLCSSVAFTPPATVQPKPIQIKSAGAGGSGEITLSYRSGLELHGHNKELSLLMQSAAKLRDNQNQRTFTGFDLGLRVNGTPVPRNVFYRMTQSRTQGEDDDSKPSGIRSEVQGPLKNALSVFGEHLEEVVATLNVAPPGDTLTPQQSWSKEQPLSPDTVLSRAEPKRVTVHYTYVGVRKRASREEAAITIRGEIQLTDPKRTELRVNGIAWVDVATGSVSLARATFDLDTNVTGPQAEQLAAGGVIDVRLERKPRN